MAAEIPIIMAAEVAPVVAPLRWSQLDVQNWAHVKPIKRRVVLYCTYMYPYVHRTCMYVCV